MAASIPNTEAIHHLGSQFTHNIFASAQKGLNNASKNLAEQHVKNVKTTQANRNKFAASAAQGVQKGRTAFVKGQQQQAKAASNAAKAHAAGVKSGNVAPAPGAAPRTFAMGTTPQQKAQAKATAAGAKTQQQQMNFAHGQALTFQAAQFKTMQSQRNYAHGQAIQQQNQMNKQTKGTSMPTPKVPSLTPGFSSPVPTHTPIKPQGISATTFSSKLAPQKAIKAPSNASPTFSHASTQPASLTPAFSHSAPKAPKDLNPAFSDSPSQTAPMAKKIAPATFSSQFTSQKPQQGPSGSTGASFSHGSTPSTPSPVAGALTSSQFSSHAHPAGSATTALPSLTASQPKPNTFTVGSRNAKPNGIAAKGSQLEAWAQSKSSAVQARRASVAAGGRDKNLSSTAKTAEGVANQPLSKFTE